MALWTVADQAGVGVPPEHALFLGEDDAVGEGGAGLDEAVRDVLRPIGPRVPLLVLPWLHEEQHQVRARA